MGKRVRQSSSLLESFTGLEVKRHNKSCVPNVMRRQVRAGEGQQAGQALQGQLPHLQSQPLCQLLRRLSLSLRGQKPAAEKSFPQRHERPFREEKHYGEITWLSQSRYNCYVTIIVNAVTETACTGSGFKVWFLEEHGCTLNSKTCVFSFNDF